MPNVDPMSLKFNTKLDNTDFEKGTEEIRQALQSLRDTVSESSQAISRTVPTALRHSAGERTSTR